MSKVTQSERSLRARVDAAWRRRRPPARARSSSPAAPRSSRSAANGLRAAMSAAPASPAIEPCWRPNAPPRPALASGVGAHTALAGFLPKWLILLDSGLLILFSAFCFVAGVWRQFVPGVPPPEPDVPQLSPLGSARRERFAGVCVARGTGRAVAKSGMRHKSDMRHMPLRRHISVMSVVRLAR